MLAVAPTSPAAILDRRDALEAELARRSLHFFIRKAWSIIEPDQEFTDNWHLVALCREAERLTTGDLRRLIVNVPPGTMKTLIFSVFWPAWMWATNPSLRFFLASYQHGRSIDAAGKLHDIVTSDWYQEHFGVALSDDQDAKTRFNTADGGWVIASSPNGVGQGEHPDFFIIDDPINEVQSRSAVERAAVVKWIRGTALTRGVVRGVRVVLIMQRLHADDPSGYLLGQGGWEHVCFPMRYEPTRVKTESDAGHTADPRDPRNEAGQLLWPQLFPEQKIRQLEIDLGPYGTAGQLQQRPAPEGGGLFKREWFKFVDAAPVQARRVRGWDTAATEGGGDNTSSTKIAEADSLFYIEDNTADQLSPAGVDALMKQKAMSDGKACGQREEKEGGSAGKSVVDARAKMLVGYDYKFVQISGDKVTRAKPFRAQCEAGNVYIVVGSWNDAYISELCDFPTGKRDDRVDSSSCAFNAVLLEPQPVKLSLTWGRK